MYEPPRIEKRAPPPSRWHNKLTGKLNTICCYTNGVDYNDDITKPLT